MSLPLPLANELLNNLFQSDNLTIEFTAVDFIQVFVRPGMTGNLMTRIISVFKSFLSNHTLIQLSIVRCGLTHMENVRYYKTYKKLSPLTKKVALTPLESNNLTSSDV